MIIKKKASVRYTSGLFLRICLLVIALLFCNNNVVYALPGKQKLIIDIGSLNYNEMASCVGDSAVCSCQAGGNTTIPGNDNPEKIWNFFIGKGLSEVQVAGIMGNMQAESHFEPRLVQYGHLNTRGEVSRPGEPSSLDDTPPSGAKTGYGLVQFTPGTKILPAASRLNMPPGDLGFQLTLIWEQLNGESEIPEKKAGDLLKATTTVEEASKVFEYKYERHATDPEQESIRIGFAIDILNLYGGGVSGSGPTTTNLTCGETQQSAVCEGSTSLPVSADTAIQWFNAHGHGTSVSYPKKTDGHNTILYMSNNFGAESVKNSTFTVGEAVDAGAPAGTEVFSPTDGTVLHSGTIHKGGSDGYMVIIESDNKKCVSVLAHTDAPLITAGDKVTAGQKIGTLKSIAAPHLHFELWVSGQPINIGEDPAPCTFDQKGCASFAGKAEEIWEKQKKALIGDAGGEQ